MKTYTLFFISVSFLFSTAAYSAPENDTLHIEQKAFAFFISGLDTTYIYADKFQKFKTDSNLVFYNPKTSYAIGLPLTYDQSKKPGFITKTGQENPDTLIAADSVSYPLTPTRFFLRNNSKMKFSKNQQPGDIMVTLTSRIYYNNFYYVRIFMDTGVTWKSNEALVKLDKYGNVVNIMFEYGEE